MTSRAAALSVEGSPVHELLLNLDAVRVEG
jgi:hypothetical protein